MVNVIFVNVISPFEKIISRTFKPSPMKGEATLSVFAYDNYQYFHQAASPFMGGTQSNLIVFGIN